MLNPFNDNFGKMNLHHKHRMFYSQLDPRVEILRSTKDTFQNLMGSTKIIRTIKKSLHNCKKYEKVCLPISLKVALNRDSSLYLLREKVCFLIRTLVKCLLDNSRIKSSWCVWEFLKKATKTPRGGKSPDGDCSCSFSK